MMLKPIKKYAENLKVSEKEIFIKWCTENNVTKYLDDDSAWIRIIPSIGKADRVETFLFVDHSDIFEKADGSRIWVFQPYCERKQLIDAGIYEWCQERGLSVAMSYINSWHLPDSTVLVHCEVSDSNKCIEYIKSHKTGGKNRLTVIE